MNQIFYIDIDEEITSVVDRLRKTKERDIVIVVPRRALLIQSVINLRLLKKEADALRKRLTVVTQDKLGKILVENAGIAVEQKLEDVAGEESFAENEERYAREAAVSIKEADTNSYSEMDIRKRLEKMGSEEYFAPETAHSKTTLPKLPENELSIKEKKDTIYADKSFKNLPEAEKILNRELVTDFGRNVKKSTDSGRTSSLDIVRNINIKQSGSSDLPLIEDPSEVKLPDSSVKSKNFFDTKYAPEIPGKEGGIKEFFRSEKTIRQQRNDYRNVNLSGSFRKFFLFFGLIAIGTILAGATYLFLPQTDIKIFVRAESRTIDTEIKGVSDSTVPDFEKQTIPARLIFRNEELLQNFSTTGNKSISSQKAKGSIVIYNEYSNSPQPLVATTRFLSESGKIFRLTKNVTVPGTTSVEGETKPGVIEADVIADEAGEAYNIEPATFTIPGFKDSGSGKYSKFYAKSSKSMSGGGGQVQTVKTISAADIDAAKKKLMEELAQKAKNAVKEEAGGGAIILDDAVNIRDAVYTVSGTEGEITESFTVGVKMKVEAVVFFEKDFKAVLMPLIAKAGNGSDIDSESLVLGYGKSDADFSFGNILIRVNARANIKPDIDLENLKEGILGKKEDELSEYLRPYSKIKRVEIDYKPSFISGKIPAYKSRVNIKMETE